MPKEGYPLDKKEGESKIVVERLQNYLKDKKNTGESGDLSHSYNKPSTSFDHSQQVISVPVGYDDSSNILREILNHKKAELLRQPEIVALLKTVSSDLKNIQQ